MFHLEINDMVVKASHYKPISEVSFEREIRATDLQCPVSWCHILPVSTPRSHLGDSQKQILELRWYRQDVTYSQTEK